MGAHSHAAVPGHSRFIAVWRWNVIGGRYSLDHEIGRGGAGVVWLGRDEVLGRPVAVKRVGMAPSVDSGADLMRAEREAKIAASLNHPNIVGVYDLVMEDDHQWLVMEYVEGTTLAELIRDNGPLPPDQVAPLIAQAASALAAAHASGIVHRDVKPSNILVRVDGHVKLSDFGIARASTDESLTQTGLVTGSPAYLAPEVASGHQATPASDVWSLGATLFHALAGHAPYEVTANVLGALYRIVNEPPPRLDAPGEMAPVLLATMAHDPRQRWSMEDIVRFLDQSDAMAGQPAIPTPGPPQMTQQMSVPIPAQVPAPAPPATSTPPPPPVLAPTPGSRRNSPSRRELLPLLVTLLVAVLVVAVVALARQSDPQTALGADSPGSTSDASNNPGTGASTEPTESIPAAPTEGELRSFLDAYLQTASSDPVAGFKQLTLAFQRESPRYAQFWGGVSNPRLLTFSANPEALTISYAYRYQQRGSGSRTDDESLQLVRSGSGFLIDGPA